MERKEAVQRLSTLTERQREVLGLYCQGLPFKDIGERLVIAASTARSHMANIYVELGLDQLSAAERRKLLHAVYCPALRETALPPPPPGGDTPQPVPDGVERMVDEDMRALVVYKPSPLVPVSESHEPTRRRPRRLLWFLAGATVMAIAATAFYLSGWLDEIRPEPARAEVTPHVEMVPVTVVHTQEIVSEVTRIITTTPEPLAPTFTPLIQTQLVVVTATQGPPTTTPEITETISSGNEAQETEEAKELAGGFNFFDDFDEGQRPEWEVRTGQPFFGNGRLGAATHELIVAIGDESLTDYSIEFDYWNLATNYIDLLIAPEVHYLRDTRWSKWFERVNNEWIETLFDLSDAPQNGHLGISRKGSTISIFLNSELSYEYTYSGELSAGPLVIGFEDEVQIDNFSLTVP